MACLHSLLLCRPHVLLARKLTPCPLLFVKNVAFPKLSKEVTFVRTLNGYGYGDSANSESERWKIKDKIAPPFELIYHLKMHPYVTFGHVIGTVTSFLVAYIIVTNHSPAEPIPKFDVRSINDELRAFENEELVYFGGFVFFITCLFMIIHKLPYRVYHWPDKGQYIFIKSGWWPFSRFKFVCDIKDIYYNKNGRDHFLWGKSTYSIKNGTYNFVLFDHSFRLPSDANTLQGLGQFQTDDDEDN